MKVFISWSGSVSHSMALALQEWLPNVIQAVKPFLSSEDIRKGQRWLVEIGSQLGDTNYGILCLTRENLNAPWLLFEAGALSKHVDRAHVVPLLLDLKPAEVVGPLTQFQAVTSPTKDEIGKLLKSMNAALAEHQLPDAQLERAFAQWWPEFGKRIKEIEAAKPLTHAAKSERSERDMIEEILRLVRAQVDVGTVESERDWALRELEHLKGQALFRGGGLLSVGEASGGAVQHVQAGRVSVRDIMHGLGPRPTTGETDEEVGKKG